MRSFKPGWIHLLPVALSLALSASFAHLLSSVLGEPILWAVPFEEEGAGPAYNALYFVGVVAAAGVGVYSAVRLRLTRLVNVFVAVVHILLTLALTSLYLPLGLWLLGLGSLLEGWALLAAMQAALVAFAVYSIFLRRGRLGSVVLLVQSSGLGAFMGFSIPTLSAVAMMLALAVYDVYAVFKGPLGKMARIIDLERMVGLVFTYSGLKIGLGDLVFYSMLVAHTLVYFGVAPSIGAAAGVTLGAYLSMRMLRRNLIFPGLPLALALGLAFSLPVGVLTSPSSGIWPR